MLTLQLHLLFHYRGFPHDLGSNRQQYLCHFFAIFCSPLEIFERDLSQDYRLDVEFDKITKCFLLNIGPHLSQAKGHMIQLWRCLLYLVIERSIVLMNHSSSNSVTFFRAISKYAIVVLENDRVHKIDVWTFQEECCFCPNNVDWS